MEDSNFWSTVAANLYSFAIVIMVILLYREIFNRHDDDED